MSERLYELTIDRKPMDEHGFIDYVATEWVRGNPEKQRSFGRLAAAMRQVESWALMRSGTEAE